MKHSILTIIAFLFSVNLFAQSSNLTFHHYFKVDSTYVIADDTKDNWYTLELKADTVFQNEDNKIIYDNKKLLQINVIPFSEILPNQKKAISIPKALEAYKKWELSYQQEILGKRLKSKKEFYYQDKKPFLIWWQKNPPEKESVTSEYIESEYDIETDSYLEYKTLNVSHMLCLNFSIYAKKNVAITIPVFEDENLQIEIDKLKEVANSIRVYGGPIDLDILIDKMQLKENYVLSDSLNMLELKVPDWLNVIRSPYEKTFSATFPERHEVVNAMIVRWEYKSDSLGFNDFINRTKPYKERPNYKLIEENDTALRYFYTSENGWFHQQNVYLKGENIYCFINFTATNNTYNYNIGRFEEIIKGLQLK